MAAHGELWISVNTMRQFALQGRNTSLIKFTLSGSVHHHAPGYKYLCRYHCTVQRAQLMTLADQVHVVLSKMTQPGQLAVALSRVRNAQDLSAFGDFYPPPQRGEVTAFYDMILVQARGPPSFSFPLFLHPRKYVNCRLIASLNVNLNKNALYLMTLNFFSPFPHITFFHIIFKGQACW